MRLSTGRGAIRGSALALLLLGSIGSRRAPVDAVAAVAAVDATPTLASLPSDFVENRGQWSGSARFVARRGSLVAAFDSDSFQIRRGDATSLALRFEGASRDASLAGVDRRPGEYNFFLGKDARQWRSRVPAWGGVLYRGLYPGVDVRVREEHGRLEYDVMLAPGARLEDVVVRAEEACGLELEPDGSLSIQTAAGTLRQSPPRTWEVLADGRTRPVASRFVRLDSTRYGFSVPERDATLSLVVDPGLEWSTFLGGFDREEIHGLAVAKDGSGDVIVAGSTWSFDFPATGGARGTSPLIPFVARLSSDGTALVYATLFGGNDGNVSFGLDLALDPSSGPVVVGETNSASFPTTPGVIQPDFNEPAATINRGWDGFVTRFDPSGSLMIFSTFLGAAPVFDPGRVGSKRGGDESARAVAVDASGAVIIAGTTSSDAFPTTAGAYDRTHETLEVDVSAGGNPGVAIAETDSFVTRIDPTGSQIQYSTFLGGQADDAVRDLVVDSQGFVTLVGDIAPARGHSAKALRRGIG